MRTGAASGGLELNASQLPHVPVGLFLTPRLYSQTTERRLSIAYRSLVRGHTDKIHSDISLTSSLNYIGEGVRNPNFGLQSPLMDCGFKMDELIGENSNQTIKAFLIFSELPHCTRL